MTDSLQYYLLIAASTSRTRWLPIYTSPALTTASPIHPKGYFLIILRGYTHQLADGLFDS